MQKPWVVLTFGGTSVAQAERWDRIAGVSTGMNSLIRPELSGPGTQSTT